MVDVWVQSCFAFSCSPAEMALLEEAFQASYDLGEGCMPHSANPSPAMQALFPALGEDRWAGFRDIFPDRDFPSFGAILTGGNLADRETVTAIITSETAFDPEAVARVIQRCCCATLRIAPIGFEWSVTASRMRVGEFSGGWCALFHDHIEVMTTGDALGLALNRPPPLPCLQETTAAPTEPPHAEMLLRTASGTAPLESLYPVPRSTRSGFPHVKWEVHDEDTLG